MKERLGQFKRIMAAVIDIHIVFLINIIVYGLVVTVWRICRDFFYNYSKRHNKFLLPVPAKAIYGSFCRTENEIFNVVNYI